MSYTKAFTVIMSWIVVGACVEMFNNINGLWALCIPASLTVVAYFTDW